MGHCAVVGGQFGSEGKGLIVSKIAWDYDGHVRVGAANAGHTIFTHPGKIDGEGDPTDSWEKHVMQQVPCAAYANPRARLFIGPGALISPEIFHAEIDQLARWRHARGIPPILIQVDRRAHIVTEDLINREQRTDLAERIGSTSTVAREGVGSTQAARVMREAGCVLAGDFYDDDEWWDKILLNDVPREMWHGNILLEGTQGTGLSLTTGAFPYVTSRNTTVAGLCGKQRAVRRRELGDRVG
jgi:adenylosuccinate synthase